MAAMTKTLFYGAIWCCVAAAATATDSVSTSSTFSATGTVPPIAPTQCPEYSYHFFPGTEGYRPGFHCDSEGYTTKPGWLERFKASPIQGEMACFDRCRFDLRCVSYAFNQTNYFCRTFGTTVEARNFTRDRFSTVLYTNLLGCWECDRNKGLNETENLKNPNFDDSIGLPGLPLLYPGWNAGTYSEESNVTLGIYGALTGVTPVALSDNTMPGGVNNVVEFDTTSTAPVLVSQAIEGLNVTGFYILNFVYYIEELVFAPGGGRCLFTTQLSESQTDGGSEYNNDVYVTIEPDRYPGPVWHDSLWSGQPTAATQYAKIVLQCTLGYAKIYVDQITLKEYPYQGLIY